MSPYLLGEASKQISRDAPPLYDLYAVVYHYGNSYIGHYTNAAKAPSSEGLGENYSESDVFDWVLCSLLYSLSLSLSLSLCKGGYYMMMTRYTRSKMRELLTMMPISFSTPEENKPPLINSNILTAYIAIIIIAPWVYNCIILCGYLTHVNNVMS